MCVYLVNKDGSLSLCVSTMTVLVFSPLNLCDESWCGDALGHEGALCL